MPARAVPAEVRVAGAPGDVRISPLRQFPADLACVAGWLHTQWHGSAGMDFAGSLALVWRRAGEDPLETVLLARAGGAPVGTVSVVKEPDPALCEGGAVHLAALFVVPAFRGRGVGAALCGAAEEAARGAGARGVCAVTADREEFFARNGWACAGRWRGSTHGAEIAFALMRKAL